LIFQWFVAARDNGLLDNITLLNLPWQVGGLSLLVFKLFFEGAYENYQAALVGGQTPSRAFFSRVLLPALPIAFLIGVVLMFMSTQSLLWPLITLNSPNSMTVPLNLARMLGAFAVETSSIAAGAVRFITMGLPFMIVFVLFQVFVLDRLALLGGGSVETLPGEIAEPESVTENWN
jgi:multiple sugar transport system permease protein